MGILDRARRYLERVTFEWTDGLRRRSKKAGLIVKDRIRVRLVCPTVSTESKHVYTASSSRLRYSLGFNESSEDNAGKTKLKGDTMLLNSNAVACNFK